jgi:hypothetical protein
LACCLIAPTASAAKPGLSPRPPAADPNDRGEASKGRRGFQFRSLIGGDDEDQPQRREHALLTELPLHRLTQQAQARLREISERPTLYRRLPTQAIRCDEELFLFLTRKPESIIGIWDLMGITKVQTTRVGPYRFDAVDGSGTRCRVDLIYGDRNLHVFVADGEYDGRFTQKPIRGKGVFIFKSSYAQAADGGTTVTGTLDCYVKFESLGADLVARSLGGLIGKSADHNFIETARFISQISQACEVNPDGMLDMVERMPQVDETTRDEFRSLIMRVASRYLNRSARESHLIHRRGAVSAPAGDEQH